MVKRQRTLKTRAAALSSLRPSPDGVQKATSRRQRKLQNKKRRKSGKKSLIERQLSNPDEETTKAPGLQLDGLQEALEEAASLAKSMPAGGVSIKRRKALVRDETAQVASVRAHPAFQRNPVDALRQHLLNTVCADPGSVPPKPNEGKKESKGKKRNEEKKHSLPQFEADKEAMALAREKAKERVREKRERKAEMARAAGNVQRRNSLQGVGKIRKSPLRGRIGVKRPKLLRDETE